MSKDKVNCKAWKIGDNVGDKQEKIRRSELQVKSEVHLEIGQI